jgi:hypothetical protein
VQLANSRRISVAIEQELREKDAIWAQAAERRRSPHPVATVMLDQGGSLAEAHPQIEFSTLRCSTMPSLTSPGNFTSPKPVEIVVTNSMETNSALRFFILIFFVLQPGEIKITKSIFNTDYFFTD